MCHVITLAIHPIITHVNKAQLNWHVRMREKKAREQERERERELCRSRHFPPPWTSINLSSSTSILSFASICSLAFCSFFHSFHPELLPSPSPSPLLSGSLWLLPDAQAPGNYGTNPFGITKAFLNLLHWAHFRKSSSICWKLDEWEEAENR